MHSKQYHSRRDFLYRTISTGTLLCLGCKSALAEGNQNTDNVVKKDKLKSETDSGMTYQQMFNFAFKNWYIRYLREIGDEIGKENMIQMLERVGDKLYSQSAESLFKNIDNRTVDKLISTFWEPLTKSDFWRNVISVTIEKQATFSGIVTMTECLFAKTFRESDAADIGYAAICHADYAVANTFNPDLKLTRNKCLMNGDDCCYFEYELKT
jgi:hypothetical protein